MNDRIIITVPSNHPLIGIPSEENGQEVIRYFSDDALPHSLETIKEILSLVDAWRAISWDDMAEQLDHIRHESTPTPPVDL